MGDVPVTITLRSKKENYQAMQKAFAQARIIEARLSSFNPESDISRINRSPEKNIAVDKETVDLLLQAIHFSETTNGAFDTTFASQRGNFQDVLIDPIHQKVRIKTGIRLGLEGIAKGHILDEMGRVLKKVGVREYLINAGGDLLAKGRWQVGVKNPTMGNVFCYLTLQDEALATSGNYERGKHLFDPRTKEPSNQYLSSSVRAKTATKACALAIASFVTKPVRVKKILEDQSASGMVIGVKEIKKFGNFPCSLN